MCLAEDFEDLLADCYRLPFMANDFPTLGVTPSASRIDIQVDESSTHVRGPGSWRLELEHPFDPKPKCHLCQYNALYIYRHGSSHLNWADSTAVSFGSVKTVLIFRALVA